MRVGVKIDSPSKLKGYLEALADSQKGPLARALEEGALMIHEEAVKSIQEHRSKGIRYGNHTASLPGNPPNTDTGELVKSIRWEVDRNNLQAAVGTDLEYGAGLEFGTSKTAARPWLGPATQKMKKRVQEKIRAAMVATFKRRK